MFLVHVNWRVFEFIPRNYFFLKDFPVKLLMVILVIHDIVRIVHNFFL